MQIEELKQAIAEQEQENIRLYSIFQYNLQEEEMQPLVQQWREGSKKLRVLDDELYKIEMKERDERTANKENKQEIKTFINGYGEATKKYITSTTYERAEKRRLKEVLSFMGNR